MKKKHIFLPFAAALLLLTGCNYNDKNFEGLDEMTQPEQVFNQSYTLTDADYAAISTNKANVAMAKENGVFDDLKAVASNLHLSNIITAESYLPAFMAAKWYTADEGSAIKVTYNVVNDAPEYLAEMAAADEYKLTNADYETALGSDAVAYFYPSKPAATFLPRILKGAIANPEEGEYVAVEYNYSNTDPSTDGEQGETYDKIADAVDGPVGAYNVKGTVIATYARGFLLSDGKASILVYQNALPNYSLGDVVSVKGTTSSYSGLKQFGGAMEIARLSGSESFAYPTFATMSGAEMDAYISAPTVEAVSITGKLIQDGNYFNLTEVEGATAAAGALQYVANGVINPDLVNQQVTVTGYTIGSNTGRKYVNLMVTSIAAAGQTAPTAIGVVQYSNVGEYTVQGQVVDIHSQGFLVNDGTGSILVFLKAMPTVEIGSTVSVTGNTVLYAGVKQYDNTCSWDVITNGTGSITYPAAYNMTAQDMDAYIAAPYLMYVTYKGTLTISNGKYYNVAIDGANVAIGSLTSPIGVSAELENKEVVVTGYTIGTSSGKYVNTMVTSVVDASTPAARAMMTRAATEKKFAMYQYNAGTWTAASKTIFVNPSDYAEMGLSNNNFSSTVKPANYLPQFLGKNFPYAQNGDTEAVVYSYYDGKNTVLGAQEYNYTSGSWILNNNIIQVTDQFVFNGTVWNFDPSIVINLKKGDAYTKEFMQVNVDGVKEKFGSEYVDSYGNSEFYYGSSGYYGNVDLTPAKWKLYAPYSSMSVEEIRQVQTEHATSGIFVFALEHYHADMDLVPGVDVTVTINYDTYDSSASAAVYQIKYLVTGKGQFEYIPDSYKKLD